MEQEDHLSQRDMADIVELIGRVADMDASIHAKRHELAEGLCDLIDGDGWFWPFSCFDQHPYTLQFYHGRTSAKQVALLFQGSFEPELMAPENPILLGQMQRGLHFTRRRQQLLDDKQWYGHPHVKIARREMGFDHFIFSFYPTRPFIWSGLGLHRRWGRAAFTPREVRIVHIVTAEVPWLHRIDEPDEATQAAESLPPRLRTVQALLVTGWNRRCIAEHLGISESTARTYISQVYRHFGVGSQRELIARFSLGDGGDRAGSPA